MNLKHDQCQAWEEEIARLKEANKVLREAVEFYGDEEEGKEWGSLDEQCDIIHPSDIEDYIGGKRARQALAKADEIMGEKK